ncbi:MAG: hypothetical protein EON54_24325 [Alcaligenaceae bacterium]|nr:MAG: hypothetical protein EON54_24325 [Alcaligenaceae bacterium]
MNNMQFDEATQTYRGTVGPYRGTVEEHGQPFTAFHKPLRVTPEWIARSYLDGFAGFASYWEDQPRNEGNWESFAVKPWAYMEKTPNLLPQALPVRQTVMPYRLRFCSSCVPSTPPCWYQRRIRYAQFSTEKTFHSRHCLRSACEIGIEKITEHPEKLDANNIFKA